MQIRNSCYGNKLGTNCIFIDIPNRSSWESRKLSQHEGDDLFRI